MTLPVPKGRQDRGREKMTFKHCLVVNVGKKGKQLRAQQHRPYLLCKSSSFCKPSYTTKILTNHMSNREKLPQQSGEACSVGFCNGCCRGASLSHNGLDMDARSQLRIFSVSNPRPFRWIESNDPRALSSVVSMHPGRRPCLWHSIPSRVSTLAL
jgi:hypothetical protein